MGLSASYLCNAHPRWSFLHPSLCPTPASTRNPFLAQPKRDLQTHSTRRQPALYRHGGLCDRAAATRPPVAHSCTALSAGSCTNALSQFKSTATAIQPPTSLLAVSTSTFEPHLALSSAIFQLRYGPRPFSSDITLSPLANINFATPISRHVRQVEPVARRHPQGPPPVEPALTRCRSSASQWYQGTRSCRSGRWSEEAHQNCEDHRQTCCYHGFFWIWRQ